MAMGTVTCTKNLLKFDCMVFELCRQTNTHTQRQTHTHTLVLWLSPGQPE